jgi:hypothetical protein
MADGDVPPGWDYNPSAWRERLPVLLLGLAGLAVASYLALFQLGVLAEVWEPFFGKAPASRTARNAWFSPFFARPGASCGFATGCSRV